MRGQVTTIALVVAAGIAVFVASISTYDSLLAGRDRFYANARFPQVFVTLKRAPLSVVAQLSEIPGVAAVEPRIVRDVILDWPSAMLPVSARMVSLSHAGDEPLARLHVRRGSPPEPGDTQNRRDQRGLRRGERGATRHRCAGRAERAHPEFSRRRRRAVARICLCGETGDTDPGRPVLRRALGRPQRGGGGLRHERRVQRRHRVADPGHRPEAGDRRTRPPARALRFGRRHRPQGSAVEPFPRGRTQPAKGDVDHHSLHLLRRRGVPAQCGARTAGDRAARTDRRLEGAGLSDNPAGVALSQAGRGRRPVRIGAGPGRPALSLARR